MTEVSSQSSATADHLRGTMLRLLDIAEDVSGDLEPRLHAYNILRALFRNAELGEFVAPYVSRGMMNSYKT